MASIKKYFLDFLGLFTQPRILLAIWLLASGSPYSALAIPEREGVIVPATSASPCVLALPRADTELTTPMSLSHRAPGLLSRALDKLARPFSRSRQQVAPRTQPGPIAEGAGQGSSSLEATASPAPPTLEELLKQQDVPDNKTLVDALNAAPLQEQCQWIEKAIEWFDGQSIAKLSQAAIQDYAVLARIQRTAENSELLKQYFHSFFKKLEAGSGDESLTQALSYALAHMDAAVFSGDPKPLIALGDNLLARLDTSRCKFQQTDYPSVRATLEALFQTLLLVHEVAPKRFSALDGGFYQDFQQQLQEIADRAQYYPISYQAQLLRQKSLSLLEAPAVDHESKPSRLVQGLQGMVRFYQAGKSLLTSSQLNDELEADVSLLQEAARSPHIHQKPWYDKLCTLEGSVLEYLKNPQASTRLVFDLEKLIQNERSMQAKDQKVLRFGIVMQLQMLALQGCTTDLRKIGIERLRVLAWPTAWGEDADIMAGLLDSLALVAVQQSQSDPDRAKEADMAKKALRTFETRPTATQWLAGKTLPSKLRDFRDQATTQRTPGDEERLFSQVEVVYVGALGLKGGGLKRGPSLSNDHPRQVRQKSCSAESGLGSCRS